MTDCTLTLAYDHDADQVVLEDLPAGPAGEAGLIPAPGIELLFDRADGWLSRVFMDAGQDGASAIGEPALAVIADLLGTEAGAAIGQAHRADGIPVPLQPYEGRLANLSRLARLDAVRVTSPVAQSPWWAVEAAQLAARAGLSTRAAAETRRAVHAMAAATGTSFAGVPAAAVLAAAELVETAQPELAKKLRDHAALPRPAQPAAALSDRAWRAGLPPVAADGLRPGSQTRGLRWWLDPQVIPPDVFRCGLCPDADLRVRTGGSGILLEAELAPGAGRGALDGCCARLVNPATRTILGMASLRDTGGSRVTAQIPGQVPPGGAWVEVVGDASRPVISTQLRHIRRAMRWADAALTAGRRPPGPGDSQWARLAELAWKQCAEDWSAAQDPDRAYLAAARTAPMCPGMAVPQPLSPWAKELADRPALEEAPFLAEIAADATLRRGLPRP